MANTAYLVATIDTKGPLPVVVHVGVYSESWKSLTMRHAPGLCYADLAEGRGADYEEAQKDLRAGLVAYAGFRWIIDWLDRGGTPLGGDR